MNFLKKIWNRNAEGKEDPAGTALVPVSADPSAAQSDIMSEIAEACVKLLNRMAEQGYIMQLDLDEPKVERADEHRIYLEMHGSLRTAKGGHIASLTFSESTAPKSYLGADQWIGPRLYAMYNSAAAKSVLGGDAVLGVNYDMRTLTDPESWISTEKKPAPLTGDLRKIMNFLQCTPDPSALTRFKGFKVTPKLE